jgi:plasmid maintenance system antidote protein VapI
MIVSFGDKTTGDIFPGLDPKSAPRIAQVLWTRVPAKLDLLNASTSLEDVNELVRGKRGVPPETALLLAGYFRNSAEFWMNLQTAHDLTVARHEMGKRPVATPRATRRSAGAGSFK